ncbi:hypothetical protein RB195_023143 [Necator americanus]|uniref:Uncharacterized protein n=1 Tax=Necator americanus TaxID=51031 RepID=A0ABR1EKA0_NECAM
MTRGRCQHLAPPSKVATENRLCFHGYVLRRPAGRSTRSEKFAGLKLEKDTRPKLEGGGERELKDTWRGWAIQARRKDWQDEE